MKKIKPEDVRTGDNLFIGSKNNKSGWFLETKELTEDKERRILLWWSLGKLKSRKNLFSSNLPKKKNAKGETQFTDDDWGYFHIYKLNKKEANKLTKTLILNAL